MSTPLQTFMDERSLKDADLVEPLRLDRSMVSKIRRGIVKPTLDTAGQIERFTDGAVPMQAWVSLEGSPPALPVEGQAASI